MPMHAPPPVPAHVQVIQGAAVWTGDGPPEAGMAVAFGGGRILAAGPAADVARRFPKAETLSLPGGTLLPGFIESHAHVQGLGALERQVDLQGAATLDQALERIRAWAASHPGAWIEGRGWDQNLWPSKAFPTAGDLDAVTGDRPAALRRVDGHALWANTAALARAGITRETRDPDGGSILRDGQGRPTGILLDAAADLVAKVQPAPGPAEVEASLRRGLERLARCGFSSVADMGIGREEVEAYRRLAKAGKLPIRVFAYLADDTRLLLQELRRGRAAKGSFFQVQGVKFYLDGALGSRGARLLEPYADAPGTGPARGIWVSDPARVAADVKATLKAGFQPAIHAIGDAANREALDIYARLARKASLPPRIEHAQVVSPQDAPRFGALGVVASVQPVHCADDHAWTPSRLGSRVGEAFPWRSLLDGGALLALGSDAPVADPDPFVGIVSAETRQDASGDPPGGFLPAQRLTRAEALLGYTRWGARALGRPDLGAIKAGAQADLLWVEAPILALAPAELRRLKPGRLWVNGAEVPLEKP